MVKLVGIKGITTKTGTKGYEYSFLGDYSDYDKEHAECVGNAVFTEYSPRDLKMNVGDDVELIYAKGFQGKAQLLEARVISEGKLKINK